MRGTWSRASVAAVAAAALLAVGTVTPAEASPWEVARRTAAATLSEVRAAAAVHEARVAAQTEPPAPVAEATVKPDTSTTVKADEVGATVTFSGNEVSRELAVTVGEAAEDAAVSARAEEPGGGIPVSDPVQVLAKDGAGKQHTQFPAKRTHTRGGGKKGPLVSDVVPGVALSLIPDMDRVKANGVDPRSLKIYTLRRREIRGSRFRRTGTTSRAACGASRRICRSSWSSGPSSSRRPGRWWFSIRTTTRVMPRRRHRR